MKNIKEFIINNINIFLDLIIITACILNYKKLSEIPDLLRKFYFCCWSFALMDIAMTILHNHED